MVTLQILVLSFQVRILVAQQGVAILIAAPVLYMAALFFIWPPYLITRPVEQPINRT